MKKKIFMILIGYMVLCSSLLATSIPDFNAEGIVLIEPKTHTVLYAKNKDSKFYPASTTKILTALAIVQDLPSDMMVKKTQKAMHEVPPDSSQIGLAAGDYYTVSEGLYAVLLASDNFVCYDLALKDKGDIPSFANRMNELAKEVGAYNSHFVNPHGYHNSEHYTTPYDLAQIADAAFDNPTLAEIAGTAHYKFTVLNTGKTIDIKHTAALLDSDSPYYNPHVTSAKTGFHDEAKRTLVAKAHYDNIDLIGVVMKTNAPKQFEDMNALFAYGAENFSLQQNEDGEYFIDNHSYSKWAKPYVQKALSEGWITLDTKNYTSSLTKREFVTLLKSALPKEYVSLLDKEIKYNGPSIYNENLPISKKEAAKIIYNLFNQLDLTKNIPYNSITLDDCDDLPTSTRKAIKFCTAAQILSLNNGNFGASDVLSYESCLRIATRLNKLITDYDSYAPTPKTKQGAPQN